MNDYRAAGQELQSQVLAAARKGQDRVNSTVKTVRAAADQIRPQLANLPMPNLPTPAQLRERAPQFVVKLPTQLQTRLPKPEQLRAGAEEIAGHARSVRRVVVSQVASVAAPLAQQAATRLAQIGEPTAKAGTAKAGTGKASTASKTSAASKPRAASKSGTRSTASKARTTGAANSGTTTKVSKVTVSSDAKPAGAAKSASSAKTKPADK
ncbi:MAG TPA: hypothetical protein VGM14_21370 [Streptosporangiaceae bacterium]